MAGQSIINTVGDYKVTFSPPIGRGTFGTVHKAEHKESKQIFAAKQLILTDDGVTNEYMQDMAERELAIIQGLQTHNNRVKSFDHFFNLGVFWIFLEFCDLKNLKGYLKDHPNLNLMSRLTIMYESASAVAFMHRQEPPVIHRDLKLENIMMKREGNKDVVKITDFGLSKLLDERQSRSVAFQQGQIMTTTCGSQYFMAPEFSMEFEGGVKYDATVDTFALGLVCLVVIDKEPNKDFLPLSVEAKRAKQYVSIAEEMVANSRGTHPFPTVAETDDSDSPIVSRVKRIIRNMTKFKARQRKDMQEVEEELQETIQQTDMLTIVETERQRSQTLQITLHTSEKRIQSIEKHMQTLLETEKQKNQTLQRQLRSAQEQVQDTQKAIKNEQRIRKGMQNQIEENCETSLEQRNIIKTLTQQLDAMKCHLPDRKDTLEKQKGAETLKHKESESHALINEFEGAVGYHIPEARRLIVKAKSTEDLQRSQQDRKKPMGGTPRATNCKASEAYALTKLDRNANFQSPSSSSEQQRKEKTCVICLDDLRNPSTLSECKHTFCKECIDACFQKLNPKCPICGVVCGVFKGNQPKNGSLKAIFDLPVLKLIFIFPDGIQAEHHPNPGKPYKGIRFNIWFDWCRNHEAPKTMSLLKKAFDARVLFTIGGSSGSDQDDCVIPNVISLKEGKIYYDDFKLVQKQLAAMGIK